MASDTSQVTCCTDTEEQHAHQLTAYMEWRDKNGMKSDRNKMSNMQRKNKVKSIRRSKESQ